MTSGTSLPLISFVGRSNSGKTTLLEKLIPVLMARGHRVAVAKHTHQKGVETDIEGKDTRRLWDIGAAHIAFVTPDRIVHTHRYAETPPLEAALVDIRDVDLIIVEGYKLGSYPKIEVVRAARHPVPIPDLENRVAFVTDMAELCCDTPCFGLEDIEPLTDFVETVTQVAHRSN